MCVRRDKSSPNCCGLCSRPHGFSASPQVIDNLYEPIFQPNFLKTRFFFLSPAWTALIEDLATTMKRVDINRST